MVSVIVKKAPGSMDDSLQTAHLPWRNHAVKNGVRLVRICALRIKNRDAAADLGQDNLAELALLLGNDEDGPAPVQPGIDIIVRLRGHKCGR